MSFISRLASALVVACMIAAAVSAPSPRIQEILNARQVSATTPFRANTHHLQFGPGPLGPFGPGGPGGPGGPFGPGRPF